MPPPGYEPFLRAICANPEDNTVRLVYADWLAENGDEERAEFIRLQVAVPDRPQQFDERYARIEELRKRNWEAWFGELPKFPGIGWSGSFRRGFPSVLIAKSGDTLIKHCESILTAAPVEHLVLHNAGRTMLADVLQLHGVERLWELSLRSCRVTPGQWHVLARCPRLPQLTNLQINPIVPHGHLPQFFGEEDAQEFVTTVYLQRLESITIHAVISKETQSLLRTRFRRVWCA